MSITGFWLVDPILSMVIAVFILTGAYKIVSETVHILLEGTPRHIDVEKMNDDIKTIAGVCQVHDVHLWSVCSHIITLACHVQVNEEGQAGKDTVLKAIRKLVWEKYHVTHTIIEVESNACSLDLISQDLRHRSRHEH
jgi:cobalt-zinc-cadmium efflux system protein